MAELYKNKYRIASTRLSNWDYGNNGLYYITICTINHFPFLGSIKNGNVTLNEIGKIAEKYWQEIPEHFDFVNLDCFVIMPDHIHGILEIRKTNTNGTRQCLVSTRNNSNSFHYRYRNPGKGTISSIIGSYKSAVTKEAHNIIPDFKWLPRFYDKIIKNQQELENIRNYIAKNSLKWKNQRINK